MERTMKMMNLEIATVAPRRAWFWQQVRQRMTEWKRRADARRELRYLSTSDLKDIGLSNCEADFEASKPFWQP
jgi:uncharacterized protein YjiS (DUF1127 family)